MKITECSLFDMYHDGEGNILSDDALIELVEEHTIDTGIPLCRTPLYTETPHILTGTDKPAKIIEGFCALNRIKGKFQYASELFEKEDWDSLIGLVERPFRLNFLLFLMEIQQADNEWVWWVWTDSENPYINRKVWIKIFNLYNSGETYVSEKDKAAFDELPDVLTAYRGASQEEANGEYPLGLSFTLSEEKASWFASRYGRNGVVIEKVIQKKDILFYSDARLEQEVVILSE